MLEFNAALSTAVEIKEKTKRTENLSADLKPNGPLSADLLAKMQRYWCAANYLCVGQIYLLDNPLLREPLTKENIKPRSLGHWGTSAGQNFIYVHLNRLIRLPALHGAPTGFSLTQRPRQLSLGTCQLSSRSVPTRFFGWPMWDPTDTMSS